MPRSRGSELPAQRQSPRGPLTVRASSSDSDSHHHRPIVDRSPKVGISDRRSPRGSQPDTLQQKKKLGTRIADLESQLGQAQQELKKLKDQLDSVETAKREAQAELENKIQKPILPDDFKEEDQPVHDSSSNEKNVCNSDDQSTTDVFEVPIETKSPPDPDMVTQEEGKETKTNQVENGVEPPPPPTPDDSTLLKEEINSLNEKLMGKEKELEMSREENERLKKQAKEAGAKAASALAKEEESVLKLSKVGEELEESKVNMCRLKEKLEAVEAEKGVLEVEMKKLTVQTEQWRKAADAAAAILSGGVEMNGRRVAERCGSMDKHLGSGFGAGDGFGGFVGSPLMADDMDDGYVSGKKKGAGIRMFGDLWKKKGQK